MTPEEQYEAFKASCTHYRKGHVVHAVDGSVVFDGTEKVKEAHAYWKKISKRLPHMPEPKGCNAAKQYVKSNGLQCYKVD